MSEGNMEKTFLSWEDVQNLSNQVAENIATHAQGQDITLVAVSRGGLIPAQLIAYKLDIRDIRVMKLISYEDEGARQEVKDISTDTLPNGENVYFIDDLADSGSTLAYIKQRFPQAHTCVLLSKECTQITPDIVAKSGLNGSSWIVFPWD
jgi:xanthine phosphoribosyltransferase